jgi:hypothetical protein
MGRDSSVSKSTGYGLDDPGSIPGSARFFSSPQRPDPLWGPPSLLSLFLGLKWQERKADYSLPSSAEFKKGRAITPLPHMTYLHVSTSNYVMSSDRGTGQ